VINRGEILERQVRIYTLFLLLFDCVQELRLRCCCLGCSQKGEVMWGDGVSPGAPQHIMRVEKAGERWMLCLGGGRLGAGLCSD